MESRVKSDGCFSSDEGDEGGHHQGGSGEDRGKIIGLSPYYISRAIYEIATVNSIGNSANSHM